MVTNSASSSAYGSMHFRGAVEAAFVGSLGRAAHLIPNAG